ncbi:MAG: FAD-binding oxidoreductase [Candidatus Helarchaeota archaeon]
MNKNKLLDGLKLIVGEKNASIDEAVLFTYSFDVSQIDYKPDIVVRPTCTEEIVEIVKFASRYKIPITPRGAGSGASGGAVPVKGGILIDFTRMNKIKRLDRKKLEITVEPGVVLDNLNNYLAPYGLFFPIDLGSSKMATVGGTISNNGGGLRAVKYKVTKNYVKKLKIILPDGEILETSLKRINGSYFDLSTIFIGAEGTLGIISEVTLGVLPIPNENRVIMAVYNDLENAAKTVPEVFKAGVLPSAMEILDKSAIIAINKYKPEIKLPEDVEAILLFEVDGKSENINTEIEKIFSVCQKMGSIKIEKAKNIEESSQIWEARSLVGAAATRFREGYSRVYVGEDITVPLLKLPLILRKLRELSSNYDLPIIVFGHIGDSNLHPAITIQKDNPEHIDKLSKLMDEIHFLAINEGGVVTGEHGIGIARAKYLKIERPEELKIMRLLKKAIDKENIMNPGKMDLDKIYTMD